MVHDSGVHESRTPFARRVFIQDHRREQSYLRATWHVDNDQFVISHWNGAVCIAATRIASADAAELVALLTDGIAEADRLLAEPHAVESRDRAS